MQATDGPARQKAIEHPPARSARWRWTRRASYLTAVLSTALAAVYAAQSVALQSSEARPVSIVPIVVMSLVQWWLWGLCTPLVFAAADRWDVTLRPRKSAIGLHVGLALALSLAQSALTSAVAFQLALSEEPRAFLQFFSGYAYSRLQSNLLLYGMLLFTHWSVMQTVAARARAVREAELEGALARAELDALRMQLNPHFLFNTLHAIRTLVDTDPSSAREMLIRLGDLLHATLDASATQETTLEEELALLRGYFDIELTRFAGRLTIDIDVPDALLHARIPSFALQPLAENAIRHGTARLIDGGTISLRARVESAGFPGARGATDGPVLVLEMDNPMPTMPNEVGPETVGHGVGLASTRARLVRLYGPAASLDFNATSTLENSYVRVTLRLPLRTEPPILRK